MLLLTAIPIAKAQNTFPAKGNVGVGTSSPTGRLHVHGGGVIINGMNRLPGVNGFRNSLQFDAVGSNAALVFNPGHASQLMFGFHSNGNMYWGNDTVYTLTLSRTGYLRVTNSLSVGGNLKAGSKMSVDGKLSAREVEVTTSNWPDYVFTDTYQLMPLAELRSFVNTHQHLPEIPKAAEVERDGLALGEMNKLLLKKIEELTLYLLEKEERLSRVEARLLEMEKDKDALSHDATL